MLRGKRALVCGGTSGIGNAIAKLLASPKYQANVIIVGRNEAVGSEVVRSLQSINPSGDFKFESCDATKLASITEVCDKVKSQYSSLNYLFMTQGIATMAGRTETTEGLDQKMVLHYYGRAHMVRELLPIISTNSSLDLPNLVMSVFSAGKHTATYLKDDLDLRKPGNYTLSTAAMAPGFYTDLALDTFAREIRGVKFIHAAPGTVRTGWGKELSVPVRLAVRFLQLFMMAPEKCAENMLSGAFATGDESNFVLMDPKGRRLSPLAGHTEDARQLIWAHTTSILNKYSRSNSQKSLQNCDIQQSHFSTRIVVSYCGSLFSSCLFVSTLSTFAPRML